MFKLLRRFARPPAPATDTYRTAEPDPAIVTRRIRIRELLETVQRRHCLLSVRSGNDDDAYLSAILEVVGERGYFVLDELSPADTGALQSGTEIRVSTRLDGVDLRFTAHVAAAGDENGVPFYKVPFPRQIDYGQQRRHLRVSVPLYQNVNVKLQTPTNIRVQGELRDISLGGFNARLTQGVTDEIRAGFFFPRCVIALPDEGRIYAPVEVCYAEQTELNRPRRIGARFVTLSRDDERMIQRFVADTDRELSRKRVRL
ncbi:MAG: hypothetical protein HKO62_04680 [Gammaproteobacteria bacterium]|nr:flagellar brake protein [Gammaproteobacteria bacterium]NNM00025.1 hypothetical protein [Gammaproteobacteria bacterium]